MKADRKVEVGVRILLEKMAEAYRKKDVEGVMSCYAVGPDVVSYGTGKAEKYVGPVQMRKAYERDFAQSESVALTFDWLSVSTDKNRNVAWFASDITVRAKVSGKEVTLPGRLTGVMEKRAGNWLIVQVHFSLPAAEQPEGRSFPGQEQTGN